MGSARWLLSEGLRPRQPAPWNTACQKAFGGAGDRWMHHPRRNRSRTVNPTHQRTVSWLRCGYTGRHIQLAMWNFWIVLIVKSAGVDTISKKRVVLKEECSECRSLGNTRREGSRDMRWSWLVGWGRYHLAVPWVDGGRHSYKGGSPAVLIVRIASLAVNAL